MKAARQRWSGGSSRVFVCLVLCVAAFALSSPIKVHVAYGGAEVLAFFDVISGKHYRIVAIVPGVIYRFSEETSNGRVYGYLGGLEMRKFLSHLQVKEEDFLIYGARCEVTVDYIFGQKFYGGTTSYPGRRDALKVLEEASRLL